MTTPTVVVYSTRWCPDCRVAKRVLGELGVPFEEIDIEHHPGAAEIVIRENQGKRRVPTIAVDGRYYGNPGPAELRSIVAAVSSTTAATRS